MRAVIGVDVHNLQLQIRHRVRDEHAHALPCRLLLMLPAPHRHAPKHRQHRRAHGDPCHQRRCARARQIPQRPIRNRHQRVKNHQTAAVRQPLQQSGQRFAAHPTQLPLVPAHSACSPPFLVFFIISRVIRSVKESCTFPPAYFWKARRLFVKFRPKTFDVSVCTACLFPINCGIMQDESIRPRIPRTVSQGNFRIRRACPPS